MEVKWTNAICFALLLGAFLALIYMQDSVLSFLSALGRLGPEHQTDQQVYGLICLGLILVTLVGVLKILMQDRR